MRIIFISFLVIALSGGVYAQIDDIKKNADKNTDDGDQSSSNSDNVSYNADDGCADMLLSGCAGFCFDMVFSVVGELLIEHHRYIMDMREETPFALSLAMRPLFAYSPDDYVATALSGLRGSWGVYSTDFRMNYLIDLDERANLFYTWSWQLAMLNIVPVENFRITLGTGIYYEQYTAQTYNEHFAGVEILSAQQRWWHTIEARGAWSYQKDALKSNVFHEVNARSNLLLLRTQPVSWYLTGGIMYQSYYGETHIFSAQTGMMLSVH